VHSVAIDVDNKTIASGSWDGTVKLYNIECKDLVQTLGDTLEKGKMGGLYSVRFAHNTTTRILGCASCDHSAYIWNTSNGELLTKLAGHKGDVNDLDFHPKQNYIMCTVSDDTKAIIWDYQQEAILRSIDAHTNVVYGTIFMGNETENQHLVATCSYDRTVRIFDMRDREVVKTLEGHGSEVLGVDFFKKQLVTGANDGVICIWDQLTWQKRYVINTIEDTGIKKNRVKRVRFSPDGFQIAAACSSKRVLVYDIHSNPILFAKLRAEKGADNGHSGCIFDVAWGTCTAEKTLVSASHDNSCAYWREIVQ